MKKVLVLGLLFICSIALADTRQVYRDKNGRYQGSSSTSRNGKYTTFRGSRGEYLGSATKNNNGATFRGSRGEYRGSVTGKGSVTPSYFSGNRK